MELPEKVRPSPLSPHFFYGYVKSGLSALVISAAVAAVSIYGYLDFLPFNPLYLLVLALPFLWKLVQRELQRRHHKYVFEEDRVKVRKNVRMSGTVEQEDVPYDTITDVSSESPPWERLVDVGDLTLHMTGSEETVTMIGLRHPDRYEDLLLGRYGGGDSVEELRRELEELERRYENGEIGREEYERRYYYLEGRIDALEGDEDGN